MVETGSDGLLARLRLLSKRELQVLDLRCQGMKYRAIGKELNIVESTVKTDMGRVYMKLGLDVIERSKRLKTLYDTVCPLLQLTKSEVAKGTAAPVEKSAAQEVVDGEVVPEQEEPIPPKVKDMVEEDGKAIVPVRPAPLVGPPPRPKSPFSPAVLIAGVVLGICLGAGGLYLIAPYFNSPIALIPRPSPTVLAPTAMPSDTAVPLASPEASTPMPQVVMVTATMPPATAAPTAIPAPVLSLPFADNFDNGANPDWQPVTSQGTWRVINGKYTETGERTFLWSYSMVGDPGWQDYTVDVDYSLLKDEAAGVAVLVRSGEANDLHLAFIMFNYEASWKIWQDGQWQTVVTSDGAPNIQGHIKVVVAGSTFTASANGISPLVITDASTSSGKVGLGVECRFADACPLFDNFSVK